TCSLKEGVANLFIEVRAEGGGNQASVRLEHEHTNITCITRNGKVIYEDTHTYEDHQADKSSLNIRDIVAFADEVRIEEVKDILSRQIQCNYAISEEGLKKPWGAGIGHFAKGQGEDVRWKAIARATAGSDARMSGCPLPVIINSGSGNQ